MYKCAPLWKDSQGGIFMKFNKAMIAGACAGAVSGLFGAGGGMLLVPLLCRLTDLEDDQVFPTSVAVILPVCITCLFFHFSADLAIFATAFPYLIGSALGGVLAGFLAKHIPTTLLHRILGILILWGGIRYLC